MAASQPPTPRSADSNSDGVVALYQELAGLSALMLESAQQGDWDTVATHEHRCAQLVEQLRQISPDNYPSCTRTECIQSIRTVLANDAAIRDLAQPWLKELEDILRIRRTRPVYHSFR